MRETLNNWIRILSPSCRHVALLQSRSLDGPLSFWERLGMRLHLVLCRWCRRYRDQIHFIRKAAQDECRLHGHSHAGLPPASREQLKELLRENSA